MMTDPWLDYFRYSKGGKKGKKGKSTKSSVKANMSGTGGSLMGKRKTPGDVDENTPPEDAEPKRKQQKT
jgi:hypothetical protein